MFRHMAQEHARVGLATDLHGLDIIGSIEHRKEGTNIGHTSVGRRAIQIPMGGDERNTAIEME